MVFWGIEVTHTGVTFTPPFNLHITSACLGVNIKATEERNILQIKNDDGTFPLCSLKLGGVEHTALDIILSEGIEVFFSASGKNSIHLTGYFVDSMLGEDSDEDSDDEQDGVNALMNGEDSDEEDDDEDDDDEEFFDEELSKADEKALQAIINSARDNKSKATTTATNGTNKQVKEQPKEQPKQDNKRKAEAQITKEQPKTAKTVESPSKTPTKKEPAKVAASTSPNKTNEPIIGKVITTRTGLQYQDVKIGSGPNVVVGKNVTVHYTGKLANTGKIFDSSLRSGKPFSFRLGMSQVIQGWDQGIAGMKVGGKRTLIVPSQLGYGKQGAGKDIPPNSTLHFEVEVLKAAQ